MSTFPNIPAVYILERGLRLHLSTFEFVPFEIIVADTGHMRVGQPSLTVANPRPSSGPSGVLTVSDVLSKVHQNTPELLNVDTYLLC